MRKVSEAQLSRFTKLALKKSNLVHWRVSNGASLYTVGKKTVFRKSEIAGFPDWSGLTCMGQFWALELKTKTGRLSDKQKVWIKRLKESNAIVDVARSRDEILDFIKSVGGKTKPDYE